MIAAKRLKYYYPTIASPSVSMDGSDEAAAAAVTEHEQEFQKELYLMSKLRHPNIVEFVGAVATPGHLAIVRFTNCHLHMLLASYCCGQIFAQFWLNF